MKLLLIRAVLGTALICLAIVLATFVLPPEHSWLPRWLATNPGEVPEFTTVALLIPMIVILRMSFGWAIRDLAATSLLVSIILALHEIRTFGFRLSALNDFAQGLLCLTIILLLGLLIAAALSKLRRPAPTGGPAPVS